MGVNSTKDHHICYHAPTINMVVCYSDILTPPYETADEYLAGDEISIISQSSSTSYNLHASRSK
jgi:hypothetical protein